MKNNTPARKKEEEKKKKRKKKTKDPSKCSPNINAKRPKRLTRAAKHELHTQVAGWTGPPVGAVAPSGELGFSQDIT